MEKNWMVLANTAELSPLSTGALYGRVTIPDAVTYNFDLLKMSILLLKTCGGI
jgi:hypothetical protein